MTNFWFSGIIKRMAEKSRRHIVPLPHLSYLIRNTPPAKASGFGLRLKAGLIGHSADYPPLPQGEGWGERSEGPGNTSQAPLPDSYPLILAFSRREKVFNFAHPG